MNSLQRIDRYEIRGLLGEGAMGHVYLAWDPKLHREVALKVVAKGSSSSSKDRERFHREARAIAALRHPNIVEIYDYSGRESAELYLVMERLDGDDLFNVMTTKGVVPEAAAAAVGHELCLALNVAHESGVIHRDIKPENVFMSASGRVTLTDFGVVKAIREGGAVEGWSNHTDVIGTPGFMAPELMMNRALGPRTDIFALGALLFNISTGHLPFAGDSAVSIFRNVVGAKMSNPREFNRKLSREFVDVLTGCLEAKPKNRFRSAEQVRKKLKQVLELNGVSDLRDDLRDFMRDPAHYLVLANGRAVNLLVNALKVSIKDGDEAKEGELRDRLLDLDPDSDVVHTISGLRQHVDLKSTKGVSRSGSRRWTRNGRVQWLSWTVSILVGVAVVLAGYLAMAPEIQSHWFFQDRRATEVGGENGGVLPPSPSDSIADTLSGDLQKDAPKLSGTVDEAEPSLDVAVPAGSPSTEVSIRVRGGPGDIYFDGRHLGRRVRHKFLARPGSHVLQIKGEGTNLRENIMVGASPIRVSARLGCRRKKGCLRIRRIATKERATP